MECAICFDKIDIFCLGSCDNRSLCYKCMMRKRQIYKSTKCPICNVFRYLFHSSDSLFMILLFRGSTVMLLWRKMHRRITMNWWSLTIWSISRNTTCTLIMSNWQQKCCLCLNFAVLFVWKKARRKEFLLRSFVQRRCWVFMFPRCIIRYCVSFVWATTNCFLMSKSCIQRRYGQVFDR